MSFAEISMEELRVELKRVQMDLQKAWVVFHFFESFEDTVTLKDV